ncbi:MAG: (d)CMP kinase [Maricaulaceae bacterium]
MIIAIDGPAGSGKGTIAKRLGALFGLPVLDTGALYRATALSLTRAGADPADAMLAAQHARALDDAILADPDLRSAKIGALASQVAAHGSVRAALVDWQRAFAAQPGGAILDGRDIGTVIEPHAPVKLFVTASLDARTERRALDLEARGEGVDRAKLRADLADRDRRDTERRDAPMKRAPDAVLLDTTELSIDAAVDQAIAVVETAWNA